MKEFRKHSRIELAPPARAGRLQESLLRRHLAYCLDRSPFYRRRLGRLALRPANFSLADLPSLPFTDKADLERHNDRFLAVPPGEIVDIVLSSGTTGKPTRVMYTESDLQRLAYNEEQSFSSLGMTARDVVLLTCTMDRCFIAGLAYFLGVRSMGAACIRNGHGSLESHLQVIGQMKPTAIVGVPTFLRKLGQHMQQAGRNPARAGVNKLICIGEPLRDGALEFLKLGADLETIWGAKAFSTYASSETVTTFCECIGQRGGHLHPDLAVVEIVDERGRVLPPGRVGEVVVTPLGITGMPLLRFKTGDMSWLMDERCPCGRYSLRLGPIVGRKKQMMKVKGTTLYPQAVFAAMDRIDGIAEYYVTVSGTDSLSDELTVHAAVNRGGPSAAAIGEKLQAALRVRPRVRIEPGEKVRGLVYTPASRKPVRFVDERKYG